MIFDTNVLVYLSRSVIPLSSLFTSEARISIITKIEALGYAFKNIEEQTFLTLLCQEMPVIDLTYEIAQATIDLRKRHRIKLPDAIIYAPLWWKICR